MLPGLFICSQIYVLKKVDTLNMGDGYKNHLSVGCIIMLNISVGKKYIYTQREGERIYMWDM